MKTYFILMVFTLALVGCTSLEQESRPPVFADNVVEPESLVHDLPRECYLMIRRDLSRDSRLQQYACFGCASGICKEEDLNQWDYVDQREILREGYSCEATSEGCVLQYERPLPQEISFIDFSKELECLYFFDQNEFVISTEEAYASLLSAVADFPSCTNFQLPSIDFTQYTLLGKYTSGGGCSVDFVQSVSRDDALRKITYTIDVVEEGTCRMFRWDMNWILLPKVPEKHTFEFVVT